MTQSRPDTGRIPVGACYRGMCEGVLGDSGKTLAAQLPIGEGFCEEAVESGAVGMHFQVAEFVEDYVVDAVDGCPDEVWVDDDSSVPAATAPASCH